MNEDLRTGPPDSARVPLKTYATPRLMVHGSLRDITRKVGKHAKVDGGFIVNKRNSAP